VGAAANTPDDKGPFELEAGFYGEVPLQRRTAQGKIVAAQAKLTQLEVKRQFVRNKIRAAVQDAVSAMTTAGERIARAETNVNLARETLELAGVQFQEGDIDLVELNIYEQAATEAELLLISAQADYFMALADYRAVLALDPSLPL
jgi:outer membrane protein TolC